MADKTLNGMKAPRVSSLGAAGTVGRVRRLVSDGHLYYDDGVRWNDLSALLTVNTQSGTTYTLVASDAGKEIRGTNAAAKTFTIPGTATLGTDFICSVANLGNGEITFAAGSGVTLRGDAGTIQKYKHTVIRAIGTDEYILSSNDLDAELSIFQGDLVFQNEGVEVSPASYYDTINFIGRGVTAVNNGTIDVIVSPFVSKGIAIPDPVTTDDIWLYKTPVAITVSKMAAILVGSATPSVTWTIRFATDRSAAGTEIVTGGTTTTSTTTGSTVTSFTDATIPADSHIWIKVTAKSGTVTQLGVQFEFTED